MPVVSLTNVTFAHEGAAPLFDRLTLALDTDWKLGLIGRNGCGKTTFLKLLAGQLEPRGTIHSLVPRVYFPLPIPDPALTPLELAQLRDPTLAPWRLEKEIARLGLAASALAQPFERLSRGETAKALLATLFLTAGVWPLIDEPASGLDAAGRRAVGSYLASQRGFVLVSHDRYLLDSCVDHLLAIGPAGLTLERGDYSSWLANRDKREAFEASRRQKLSKEAERLAEAARRSTEWSSRAESGKFGAGPVDRGFIGHKAAKLQRRAKSQEKRLHKALEEKKALSFAPEKPGALTWRPLASPKRLLASGRNLTLAYQERPVLRGLDFDLAAGERLALLGPNGCGKSLLMSLFLGQARILRGEFSRPASLIISYAPQIPIFPSPTFSRLAQEWGLAESRFKAVLNYLGFDKRHFETELASLSQGQKKKVFLAASLMREAHLYLWDEPLDHLDLESREQLEELILSDGPSLVVVEHDQRFLERVATRSLDLTPFSQTVAENEFA